MAEKKGSKQQGCKDSGEMKSPTIPMQQGGAKMPPGGMKEMQKSMGKGKADD